MASCRLQWGVTAGHSRSEGNTGPHCLPLFYLSREAWHPVEMAAPLTRSPDLENRHWIPHPQGCGGQPGWHMGLHSECWWYQLRELTHILYQSPCSRSQHASSNLTGSDTGGLGLQLVDLSEPQANSGGVSYSCDAVTARITRWLPDRLSLPTKGHSSFVAESGKDFETVTFKTFSLRGFSYK